MNFKGKGPKKWKNQNSEELTSDSSQKLKKKHSKLKKNKGKSAEFIKDDKDKKKFSMNKSTEDNEKKSQKRKSDSEKKSQKRKSEEFEEVSPKKIKLCEMKFKDRKQMRKKSETKSFDVVKTLKSYWEDLRREDCEADKKSELLKQTCNLIKGHVKEFAFAHDTVRILECVMTVGTEEHRTFLFEELKDEIVNLSKSKYGKFFVMKVLRYGTKKQREAVMNGFHGKVTQLMKHTEAAEVVEFAFNECSNALQRCEMVQEFYGSSYRHFKDSNIHNLTELLLNKPETKTSVINSMKEELLKVLGKSVVKHSLIHHVLLQFFLNCDPASRTEIIESLCEVVPEILHTKDGSRVAMHCVWYGNHKHRKSIIKHMKTFVKKIAMEEHGHMVLLALFDCVDDTAIIEKIIIKELQDGMLEIAQNVHGRKVLIYLLSPRDSHFIHPHVINLLKAGDNNENSKKDPEKRHEELKMAVSASLIQLILNNIAEMYKNNAFCLFTVTVLKHAMGDKGEVYQTIASLASEPYTSENKNVHIVENGGSFFMLKQLILNDKMMLTGGQNSDAVSFSEVFVQCIPAGIMKTWTHCNRGAFLLVNLIETEIPAVVNKIKEEMTGYKSQLNKLKNRSKGVEILLEKLRKPVDKNSDK